MRTNCIAVAFLLLCSAASGAEMPESQRQPLVERYCAGCHNDRTRSGGFSWKTVDWTHPERTAETSEKVIRKLQAGMMPPAGMPRPSAEETSAFIAGLSGAVDRAAVASPYAGRPPLHRLNRTEYANAIRDLLAVNIDVTALLPPDVTSRGFDNMADVLTTSPALMDAYLRAAGKVSRLALGDPEITTAVASYSLPKELSQSSHVEGAPLGTRGGLSIVHNFPADAEYVFKADFYHVLDGPLFGKILGKGYQLEVSVDGARVTLFDIDPKMTKWDELRTPPTKIPAGPHRVTAAFLDRFEGPVEDAVMQVEETLVDLNEADIAGLTSQPHLNNLFILGPLHPTGVGDTPSRRKVLVCRPAPSKDEIPCARKILGALARHAYRRPVGDPDLERLMNLYQQGRNSADFEAGIRLALQAILASPEFVFRFERPAGTAAGANYRIADLELASRLAFFLWSSMPDEELLSAAAKGNLRTPAVLEKQVRRMLADPRAAALSTNFASQWLHLQNLKAVQPDAYQFPNYSRNISQSMLRETQLLFGNLVQHDESMLDLLTSDYTFVDEPLARYYGIPNVAGPEFRRVPIADPNRRGLLGQASILTLTSVSSRTSPVGRGKYVMELLLGTPPPPPPPDVPPLKESKASGDAQALTLRQQMERHRNAEPCASCHKLMDPIGFALENFDAVGAWRARDGNLRIDASGRMFDGAELSGPASLRQAILNHSDMFLTAFAENLLAYGLGRVLDYRDMPSVRSVTRRAADNQQRFSSFVLGVVESLPFQMNAVDGAALAVVQR
jgi:Protein of unknown function (DUF1592)/Protein of unknown function (DUF1588)/Protein of unknown function (DUF1587)/Protein of unknown function (DUF1595)/Protein of unknown function (DUF1585)